ncbi:BLUF domain-containing protein [uncultured Parasphingorhabdus sp.]|uniref:BLUF domain-containing protein n=1 Tax=uncultured Parasphingorhabdus sp. TaxID=2709694 RepID=UPI0030D6E434
MGRDNQCCQAATRKFHVPANLTSLIYVSTANAALSLDDFLAILTVSQRNNQRLGITGLLVFNGTNFMQCLEGDKAATNDLLHHIERDDRHNGLTVVSQSQTVKLQFASWHMAGRYLPEKHGMGHADLKEVLSADSVSNATRTVFESFRSLGGGLPGM